MANINIQLNGETYQVRETALRNYKGKVTISGGPTEAGQLVKQFVKKNFPQYLCRVKADHFSMGNSLDVYVTTQTVVLSLLITLRRLTDSLTFGSTESLMV